MKKVMFFAMATAALFASCSSDESFSEGAQAPAVEEGYLEGHELIKIGLGNVANITTKGTGTVGGVIGDNAAANHSWAGQRFNLYMFKKGTVELAMNDIQGGAIYDNAVFEATGEATKGTAIADLTSAREIADDGVGGEIHPYKYYPNKANADEEKAYDFWAYRLDGAETAAPVKDESTVKIDFKIDGTQDILAAKAEPVSADGADYTQNANYAANKDYIFSATSARKHIYPELNFKHLLTRLTFKVLAGNANTAANVKVDSIKVISNTTGTLTIADINADMTAADAYNHLIHWTDEITDSMKLMDRKSTASAKDKLTDLPADSAITAIDRTSEEAEEASWANTPQLGEAIMVRPDLKSYKVRIFINENPYLSEEKEVAGEKEKVPSGIDGIINLKNDAAFEQGASYTVRIVIYNHEKIEIFPTLEQWKDGGHSLIDPEKEAGWVEGE